MVQALVPGYPEPSPVPSPHVPAGQAKGCSHPGMMLSGVGSSLGRLVGPRL